MNQNVNAPWPTPLETFSMESTKRCSFACYVFSFAFEMSALLSWKEMRGYSTTVQKGAQLFPQVSSSVFCAHLNWEQKERDKTSARVGCKCKSGVHSRYCLQIKRERHKMEAKYEKSHGITQWQHFSLIRNIFVAPWDEPHALFVYRNKSRRWIDSIYL